MTGRLRRNLMIALAVIAVCWGTLLTLRPSYVVEGTIKSTLSRQYPWQVGSRFELRVATAAGGEVRFRGLRGDCDGPGSQFSQCRKPEMAVSAPIRLVVHGFTDPNSCIAPPGFRRLDWWCLRGFDWIDAIAIDGRPVTSGWANSATVILFYVLVAVGIFILALNGWRPSRISLRTATAFGFVAATCLVGYAYY